MEELFTDYGLFLAKTFTLVGALIVIISFLYSSSKKQKKLDTLEVENLNDKYNKMKDVVENMKVFVDDIPNDMKRRGLSPSNANDTEKYYDDVWLGITVIPGQPEKHFVNLVHRAQKILRDKSDPHNYNRLLNAMRKYEREWDDVTYYALEQMGYK